MAKKNHSSQKKPSIKASTPPRSTTSSTTGKTVKKKTTTAKPKPDKNETSQNASLTIPAKNILADDGPPRALSVSEQQSYLSLLSKGASPGVACATLGLTLTQVAVSIEADERFRVLLDRVHELLSQNVAAALYRSAMEGSVSAQTFYLKNVPPPDWPVEDKHDDLTDLDLTDEELAAQFRTEAPQLLAFLTKHFAETSGSDESETLPGTDSTESN